MLDTLYKRGCLDGAMNGFDILIDEMQKQDSDKTRSSYKKAVELINRTKTHLDLESIQHGYEIDYMPDNTGFLRGLLIGGAVVCLVMSCMIGWGWL